ncbi:hypothetical protein [Bacillus sp. MUM 13]|uniref:hypothetical protein n=1 Tax=Bacillus sp. MUM 13 TaxID=1678001 RepID=UPI0008F5D5BC|nr:hypothetical protein [Bacillus sp. MUM 13]OIK10900.1 hypothetical protein BIV59_13560 [Bacillus sp. MUM 13]
MIYQMHFVKGLLHPALSRYQLKEAEAVTRFGPSLFMLYAVSLLVYGVGAYYGLGSESISKELTKLTPGEYEAAKMLFLYGKLAAGVVFPSLFFFAASLIYWMFLDIPYIKIVMVQMIVFSLYLLEKLLLVPISIYLNVNQDANPFSFGVISQHFTSNEYLIHLFGNITLFQLSMLALTCYYLKFLSEKSRFIVWLSVALVFIITWTAGAFLAYLDVSVIL